MSLTLYNTHQRSATFRFDLLDSSGNFIGDLGVDGSNPPTINHDTTRSINRTINGIVLPAGVAKEVNPFSDKIRPMMDVGFRSYSLGVFLFGSSSTLRSSIGKTRTASLVDQTFQVNLPIERSTSFSKGTLLTSAIAMVLAETGDFDYRIDPNPAVVGDTPLAWRAGVPALTILNDLCTLLGYYPFHFNNAGVGLVRRAADTTAATPTLTYNLGTSILDPSLVESDNLLEVPNRYIVVDTSAILAPIVGYYDVPAAFPHSFENRGFYVREVIEVQGLESVLQANVAAAAIAQRDNRHGRAAFKTPPNPLHDSYDLLWVDGTKYLEIGWSLPLVEGSEMQHTLIRIPTS